MSVPMLAGIKKLSLYFLGIFCIASATAYILHKTSDASGTSSETYVIQKGSVTRVASVSGKVEAVHDAALGFPVPGVVKEIFKKESDTVLAGEVIASLDQSAIAAEYNAALNDLAYQRALKKELVRGPERDARVVTDTTIAIARDDLERTKQEQALLVQAAYETLMSSDLEALPVSKLNNDTAPTISGNYTCTAPGTYTLSIYKSGSPTGYTFTFTGIESGRLPTYDDAPAPLGNCGLYIQFDSDEMYRSEDWIVEVPNKRGASYLTNLNAYNRALKEQEHAIARATEALTLAEKQATLVNAAPTSEEAEQADAQISQAAALVDAKGALLADRVIRAPFDGVITDINMKVGEVVDTTKTITLIRDGAYTLKARVPEVDIRDIRTGAGAQVTFDAAPNEPIIGHVEFVSPSSIEIDGVAYYETYIRLSYEPEWLREGLNADIDITIEQKDTTLVIPKRFTSYEHGEYYVYMPSGEKLFKKRLETGLVGDDGFIEALNLEAGTVVVMPQ